MVRRVKLTQEDFISECVKVHGSKYDYSLVEYKGSSHKISIICKIHGEFLQLPHSHKKGFGCEKCRVGRAGGTQGFVTRAEKIHGSMYDYSRVNYIGCFDKVEIICNVHGVFTQEPNAHVGKQQQGCPKCYHDNLIERTSKQSEVAGEAFYEKALNIHGDKYDYSKVVYVRSCKKVEVICKVHGSFWQTPNAHLAGHDCGKCALGGFTSENPGYVYILQDGVTTKVGITNKTPEQRSKVVNQLSGMDFIVTTYKLFIDGSQARLVESGN